MEKYEAQVKKLHKKLDNYVNDNEETLSDEQKENVIAFLLDGKHFDFSGVTAIRGFIYQYYVAVDYIVDMLFSDKAWWTEVIFELLDDIALYGKKRLRFVQVKTVRDSDEANNLTLGTLYERINGKGSWLDKLFLLNVHVYNHGQKLLSRDEDLLNDFELQFEVATNYKYNKDIAGVYSKDNMFTNDNQELDKHKRMREKMLNEDLQWSVPYEGDEVTFTADNYKDPIHNPDWYLDRFRVERFGEFEYLRESIIKKITSNTPGNRDEFHDLKSTYVFKMILQEVISRTCQDRMTGEFDLFIFRKEQLIAQFQQWVDAATHTARQAAGRDNLGTTFIDSFNQVRNDIASSNFNSELKHELTRKLESVQSALTRHIDDRIDLRVYERFLQRLFNRLNSDNPMPLDSTDLTRLSEALKHLIFCLVFYPNMAYSFDRSSLLFKRGGVGVENGQTFSMYSTRGIQEFDLAKRSVRNSAVSCEVSQTLNYDYHCIIADCKEQAIVRRRVTTRQEEGNVTKSVVETSPERAQQSITKRTQNIKFHEDRFIKGIWSMYEGINDFSSFQDEEIVQEWHDLLAEDDSKLEG